MAQCTVHPLPEQQVPNATVEAFRQIPASVASDQRERSGALLGIAQVARTDPGSLAGRAFTVKTLPGDNMALYPAIELAAPGDVLVVSTGGRTDRAIAGEILCRHAAAKGVGGLVLDAPVRDHDDIAQGALPVFARGANPLGPYKHGPAELRGPVAVGGTVVRHGDVVLGDGDGVVVVPAQHAEQVLSDGQALLEREKTLMARADAGTFADGWLKDLVEYRWLDDTTSAS